ncbi:hypothetical protein GR212_15570 [Rhizobium lusitanum]|uniref:Uncharacterized protein n=1 Tax=Rhizobium lusitanum TaxID=293958 RepID=A0A6L9UA63_9HYPH|nr:hypothetical protein [Rhizobium lusitanum]NEI70997.1 hypothetical protein [Rhizobium lusitanum]
MKFALVAYALISGDIHSFVLDEHLTYQDCQQAIHEGVRAAEIVPGVTVDLRRAPLVCELESPAQVIMTASKS